MKNTELVLFNKEEIPEIIADFDFETKKIKNKIFVIENKEIKHCDSCKRKIEINKIGSIAHGSRKIFCDNPLCLSTWVVKNKI